MSNKDVVTSEYSLLFGDCLERMKEIPDGSVTLAIASKRMYDLYVDWTKGRFKDEF